MRESNIEQHISLYRKLKITKTELQQAIGEDLHNVERKKAYRIRRSDVVNAIQLLLNGIIEKRRFGKMGQCGMVYRVMRV